MRLILFGDPVGVLQLLQFVPSSQVVAIVGASRRPEYLDDLGTVSSSLGASFLIQPPGGNPQEQEFAKSIASLMPDLILVNSYSMLIPELVINAARLGGLNIHASLLPRHRGPNPIQWVIIHGERETGVTLHVLGTRFDEGAIIDQIKVKVKRNDSWLSLREKLTLAINALIERNIQQILDGNFGGVRQNEAEATRNFRRTAQNSEFSLDEPIPHSYRLHLASLPPLRPAWVLLTNGRQVQFSRKVSFLRFALAIASLRLYDLSIRYAMKRKL